MNKRKIAGYALGALGVTSLALGATSAYAFQGFGPKLTDEEIASRQTEQFERTANLLGISIEEVKNAWADGKSMKDLIKEKGLSEDVIKAKMQTQRTEQAKARLDVLIKKGIITQAQAEKHLEFIKNHTPKGQKMPERGGMF